MPNDFRFIGAAGGKSPASSFNVMIAAPVASRPYAGFTLSLAATVHTLAKAGIGYQIYLHQGNCHVDDVRNEIIRDFLETDCTDLFMIDDDLDWRAESFLRVLTVPGDIVAGIYTHRSEGDTFPFHPGEGVREANEHGLFEMFKVPTGFMRIRRNVVEALYNHEVEKGRRFWRRVPEMKAGRKPMARVVERGFASEMGLASHAGDKGEYHSGDYVLCLKAKALGFKIWADIELPFGHAGEHVWTGTLGDKLRRDQRVDHPSFEKAIAAIQHGNTNIWNFDTLVRTVRNKNPSYALPGQLLERLFRVAQCAQGDILEMGSGLSTIVMGIALQGTAHKVYALEHDLEYLRLTGEWLERNQIANVVLLYAPLLPFEGGDWYGVDEDQIPEHFDVVLIDGPPRQIGNRAVAFDALGDRINNARLWLIDDVSDPAEMAMVSKYAQGRNVTVISGTSPGLAVHHMAVAAKVEAKAEAAE